MSLYIILAFAALGIGAAITAFLKTPKESRFRHTAPLSPEERLKTYPAGAQATIIRANWKRALAAWAPVIVIAAPMTGFGLWLKYTGHPECVRILGANAAYLALLLLCYGAPGGILVMSLSYLRSAINTLTTGYYPSLDAAVFIDTIAVKGPRSRLRGIVLLLMPVVMACFLYVGNNLYAAMAAGASMDQMAQKFEAKCPQ